MIGTKCWEALRLSLPCLSDHLINKNVFLSIKRVHVHNENNRAARFKNLPSSHRSVEV